MPYYRDTSTFRLAGKDILYKEPYSESTEKIRRKTIFFAFVAILHNYYPIDLQSSHLLSLSFEAGRAPSLAGLLGLVVTFLTIELVIYSVQELSAWWSQAGEMVTLDFEGKFKSLTDHPPPVTGAIENAIGHLKEYESTIADLQRTRSNLPQFENAEWPFRLKRAEENSVSLDNALKSLQQALQQYEGSVAEVRLQMESVRRDVSRAIYAKVMRVFVVETTFPLVLAAVAIAISWKSVLSMIGEPFK